MFVLTEEKLLKLSFVLTKHFIIEFRLEFNKGYV